MRRNKDQNELSLTLERYLPYRFSILADLTSQRLSRSYWGEYGLKRHEWRLMHVLSSGTTMTTQDVIAKTSLDRLRVSRSAIRLQDKGLIARVNSPADQRVHLLQLTSKGRSVYESIVPKAVQFQSELEATLSEAELASLDSALLVLTAHLRATTSGPDDASESDA